MSQIDQQQSSMEEEGAPSFYVPEITTTSSEEVPVKDSLLAEMDSLTAKGPFIDESGKIAVRVFRYKDKAIVAYLLEEKEDSFIVACPSILREEVERKSVIAVSTTSSALSRIMKYGIESVSLPTPLYLFYFLVGTRDRFSEAPSYFTQKRSSNVDNIMTMLKSMLGVDKVVTATDAKEKKKESPRFPMPDVSRLKH